MPEHILPGARLCVGFVLSPDGQDVLLLTKNRPRFLAGLLNGIGGHVEEGETPAQGLSRETHEETGLLIPTQKWTFLFEQTLDQSIQLSFFAATHANLQQAQSLTDEVVSVHKVAQLRKEKMAPDCLEAIDLAVILLNAAPAETLAAPSLPTLSTSQAATAPRSSRLAR